MNPADRIRSEIRRLEANFKPLLIKIYNLEKAEFELVSIMPTFEAMASMVSGLDDIATITLGLNAKERSDLRKIRARSALAEAAKILCGEGEE